MSSVAAPSLIAQRSPASRCKQLLLGPPLATSRLVAERLRKVVALAVFSSDAISSTAYGTEQIMLVLVTAGAVATGLALPVALGIGALLAILILSFLPRWFTKRGQRLVYSNGVLALAGAAAAVTLAFRADYNRMLPLYAIGVFTSFTFSQAGMTRRHLRLREPGWRHGIAVNGTGALVTFLVLLPRHGDQGGFRRLLHDQTGRDLLAALSRLAGVNVAIVHLPAPHPVVP
ncbi:MAG TPA: hypothetical protein VIJ32_09085 [Actinomycetes bacterium]